MAGTTVDVEDLERAEHYLMEYINRVSMNTSMLRNSAKEFEENVGSDMYSQRAIQQVESSIRSINQTMTKAEELAKTIGKKRRQIESSIAGF